MKKQETTLGAQANFGCAGFLVIIGIGFLLPFLDTDLADDKSTSVIMIIISLCCLFLGVYFFRRGKNSHKQHQKKVKVKEKVKKIQEEIAAKTALHIKKNREKLLEISLERLKNLENSIQKLEEIKIIDISDYKEKLNSIEKSVLDKGSDSKLFEFLKINSFLLGFKSEIEKGRTNIIDYLNNLNLKDRILEESKNDSLEKTMENLEDAQSQMEGKTGKGIDALIRNLFDLSDKLVPVFTNEIKTLEFYKNMGLALIIFYLNDNKMKYFEINEAFEKLGVFDKTWQKQALNKLDSIENRLGEMNNNLTTLNQNFISLIDSTENIVSELKNVNSTLMTNNLLQAFTAFQAWRIKQKL